MSETRRRRRKSLFMFQPVFKSCLPRYFSLLVIPDKSSTRLDQLTQVLLLRHIRPTSRTFSVSVSASASEPSPTDRPKLADGRQTSNGPNVGRRLGSLAKDYDFTSMTGCSFFNGQEKKTNNPLSLIMKASD